ncbi:hypothetical protein [Chitinophaga pinensis]|uniref:Uncharacterized protein n=1 Tax=Chitinophaga pinensis (strain ATCC 43595 / DSM 2588 / LMG 13176 / NBRC 15968 / NCIMB 11800 / UQM 2034) TaxID=485918 RepID=A0A979GR51_CHIPD|nr:hypothetical protein [Chitinophaga pinensis]ACU60693.1 domain of unknown function DUF1738 [Chitinophaga pinensis DSM 2588]
MRFSFEQHEAVISSDDPNAVQKLQEKLTHLEEVQQFMKDANVCIRKNNKDGFLALSLATEDMWQQLSNPRFGAKGFPPYKLTNNNQNMRRIKERIKELEAATTRESKETVMNGVIFRENVELNRVQLIFPRKPIESARKMCRKWGLIWAPSEGAWQRQLNSNGVFCAQQVLQLIGENY